MPLPDRSQLCIVLAQKAVKTVVQSSLVDSVRNGVVDFLTKQVQDLGKKELPTALPDCAPTLNCAGKSRPPLSAQRSVGPKTIPTATSSSPLRVRMAPSSLTCLPCKRPFRR